MSDNFLPGLPVDRICACYARAPGNELESGKFSSPESSAALVANTFGLYLDHLETLPPLRGTTECGWPATAIDLEAIVRFPWSGGRHPCLDVLVETESALIGVESKRYEPFRLKSRAKLSDAYWRPVWGDEMQGYMNVRDRLRNGSDGFSHLDAAQLIKHAFGLRTAVHKVGPRKGMKAVLFYLFAEPVQWPDGRVISSEVHADHREEISRFAEMVSSDEVAFHACSYRELLEVWMTSGNERLSTHALAVMERFQP